MQENNLSREQAIRYPLKLRECMIGDQQFYQKTALVMLPMIIQNTLTNLVSLLDNVMVGQTGTLPMSAVAVVSQIFFVMYLAVFGGMAGIGVYGTQYFGKGDYENVRHIIRFKLILAGLICAGAIALLLTKGSFLIGLFVAGDTSPADRAEIMHYAMSYMHVMLWGFVPFALTQVYSSTMREAGKTTLPMAASIVAMIVNFVFNGLLIFGLLGFPKLGVTGAAIATAMSRYVELGIILVNVHRKKETWHFFRGVYRHFHIATEMIRPVAAKAMPLLLNEILWSTAQSLLLQCYSVRGIQMVAAMNITMTISQIFNEVYLSAGNSAGILAGQELGANRLVNARRTSWRMASLAIVCSCFLAVILFLVAPLIPQIYNTEPEIRAAATSCIRVMACVMPIESFTSISYFIMRCGGKTLVTFFFDCVYALVVNVSIAFVLSRYTNWSIVAIFAAVMLSNIFKAIIGFVLMKKSVWVHNITI